MLLTIAVLLFTVALLACGMALRIERSPRVADWVREDLLGLVLLPLITGILAFGIIHLVLGAAALYDGGLHWTDPDVLIAVPATLVLAVVLALPSGRRWVFGPVRGVVGSADAARVSEPGRDDTPLQTPPEIPPKTPSRKMAA